MIVSDGRAAGHIRKREQSGWRCPNPACEGEKLQGINGLHKDQSVNGVRRRILRCRKCKRIVTAEERIVNTNRKSTYMPRRGQYRERAKR